MWSCPPSPASATLDRPEDTGGGGARAPVKPWRRAPPRVPRGREVCNEYPQTWKRPWDRAIGSRRQSFEVPAGTLDVVGDSGESRGSLGHLRGR